MEVIICVTLKTLHGSEKSANLCSYDIADNMEAIEEYGVPCMFK